MKWLILAFTVAVWFLLPHPANAQQNCGDRQKITERLSSGYGEHFAGGGYHSDQAIWEVWMSDDSGTWTILLTKPDGTACVIAAGTNWRGALPAGVDG